MPKINSISIKTFSVVVGILIGLGALGIFTSRADVQDTVDTAIIANDKIDDGKYYNKTDGARLEEKFEAVKEDVIEIKSEVKAINRQITQQLILLEKMNAKLGKDSI